MIPHSIKIDFPYRSRFIQLPNLSQAEGTMHYVDEGAGEVLLCLHGNPTWSFYFRNIIEHFSKKMRVIAIDHLGCGASSSPQNFAYTLQNRINHLDFFIKKQNFERVNLLVHDWGGAIGMGWAIQYPEKINKIIFLNTAAFLSRDIPKRISLCKTPLVGEFVVRRLNGFALAATMLASQKKMDKKIKKAFLWPYRNFEKRIAIARFIQDIPYFSTHLSYGLVKDIEENLHKIKGKKLFLWGCKDFCFHEKFLDKWHGIYPEAQIKKFPQAGHYILEDDPGGVIKSMDAFL